VSPTRDVIVAGLGAMGSAAAFHLARRGADVLGFDRFLPPHAHGSSHGETRIIREAYFEDPAYVPIVQRAYELWRELEGLAGRPLLEPTGGVVIGPPDGTLVPGALRSAEAHGLAHAVLEAGEVAARFPALHPAPGMRAVWEPRAGMLLPEACVEAHLRQARHAGAELRSGEQVTGWSALPDGTLRVMTTHGEHRAARLVLATGAWLPALIPGVRLPLEVTRQVLMWFEPRAHAADFEPSRCPVYIWEPAPGRFFYGFPAVAGRVKVAFHHGGRPADPDALDRVVAPQEVEAMRGVLADLMPDAAGRLVESAVCMYTNTRDGHFVIAPHPAHPSVTILSCCSGHGFKFASAIGEIAADLALDRRPRFDLSLFGLRWD
jgi:sarcosine oxidase